ncbi:MAG: glycine cleavage system protein GcvH [Candidatus Eremiobacter antarcticus]|nr:glycine cleavage system protein GcvH [Candidatus Eremiobacteraeota bacterium]MBC5807172.1 glycine cleavage system protein GcvH [Candidatus Eremiobacteraeota bacterium]PZR61002.1 MAG: glycine cleavage system protein GcvH [Candidatus Eremiobacter sp. RRmetagenome_bin22]
MSQPGDRVYTKEHEWLRIEGSSATIGITDYAQSSLGDIVYVELPKPGAQLERSKPMGVVESVKAVSDIYAPAAGTVSEINSSVEDDPAKVNADPFGDGWLVKVTLQDPNAAAQGLLDAQAYADFVASLSH